jgi:hypothetical protein
MGKKVNKLIECLAASQKLWEQKKHRKARDKKGRVKKP